ncbi:MAG TPA: twin-arginine translocase TatA/TatE family subunit [Bacteroidota bacterium]|nr:twin-arginine translocase TatA/TatE family subunit [Bacteroidota bacterium]
MLEDLSPAKILIVVLLIVVFFGAKKIPEIAQGLGKGIREFKKATREISGDDDSSAPVAEAPAGDTANCFYCNARIAPGAKFCPSCGKSLVAPTCARCNTVNALGNKFCRTCGEKL